MTAEPMRTDDYLEVRDLRVSFGDFVAVDGVVLTLLQGQVHFLVGPNGAGKTTVIDALTGLARGQGVATFDGEDLWVVRRTRSRGSGLVAPSRPPRSSTT